MEYSIVVFVHIVAATVLLGSSFFGLFTRRAIQEAKDADALLGWLSFGHRTVRLNPVVALVLLATGVYLGSVGWWTEAWFYAALVLFAVNGGWASRTIEATARLTAQAAQAEAGPVSARADRLRHARRWDVAADVLLANDLAALYLMIAKPGWLGSVAVVLAANGVLLSLRAWRWRRASGVRAPAGELSAITREGAILGAALLAPLLLGGCTRGEASTRARADRGRYLVNVLGCHDCHTPLKLGPNGPEPDRTRTLSGHPENLRMPPPPDLGTGPWVGGMSRTNTAFFGPWGVTYATNLTPDQDTGMGIWTEKMFVDALKLNRHMGVSRPILPPMPQPAYSLATEDDLRAIYAYLRTVPPISNQVPDYQPPPAD